MQHPGIPLSEAVQKYAGTLMLSGLASAIVAMAMSVFHLPTPIFACLFLAVAVLALWPRWFGDAPYLYGLVASVVVGLGAGLGFLLLQVVSAIAA
jgi:hypothetical protein